MVGDTPRGRRDATAGLGTGSGVPVEMTNSYLFEIRDGRRCAAVPHRRRRSGRERWPRPPIRLPAAWQSTTKRSARACPRRPSRSSSEKIREYANAIGADNPVHHDREAAEAAGFRDRRRAADVLRRLLGARDGPAILDPEVGINLATMVHGGQEFEWGEPVCAGDEITTVGEGARRSTRSDGKGFYVFESVSTNQDGDEVVRGTWTNIVRGSEMAETSAIRGRAGAAGAAGDAGQVPAAPLRGRLGGLQPDPHRPRVREGGRAAAQHPPRPLLDGAVARAAARRSPAATRGRSSGSRSSSAAWGYPSRRSWSRGRSARSTATASRSR